MEKFNPIYELELIKEEFKDIEGIKFYLDILELELEIIINKSIIRVYYDNCFHLFVKSEKLDSELITTEDRILDDVKTLIELYRKDM